MKRIPFCKLLVVGIVLIFTGSGIALARDRDDGGQRGDRDDYSAHVRAYDGDQSHHMMDHDWHYGGHMRNYDGTYGGHMRDYDGTYGGHMRDFDGTYGGPLMGYDDDGFGGHMTDHGGVYHGLMGPDDDDYGLVHHHLSRNEYRRLERAQAKFDHQTRELREKIDNTRYAIQREMNRVMPNRRRIKMLRKELSALQARFDHYSVEYDLALHRALPDSDRYRAYAGGLGDGYGW